MRHLAAALLVALCACNSSAGTLDRPATEQAVGDALAARFPDAGAATCPDEVAARAGERFTCTLDLGDVGTLPVDVRVATADGDLEAVPAAAVIVPTEAAEQLKASLKDEFDRSFQVDCGDDGPKVRSPGDTFTCRARDRNSRRSVTVTVTDAAGTLDFSIS